MIERTRASRVTDQTPSFRGGSGSYRPDAAVWSRPQEDLQPEPKATVWLRLWKPEKSTFRKLLQPGALPFNLE